MRSIIDFGFINDGVTDNSSFISTMNLISEDIFVPKGIYLISHGNFSNKLRLIFEKGSIFHVPSGGILTINSEIDAGHFQIFDGNGDITTTYKDNTTSINEYPALSHVKVAWFGVIPDAKHPATWGTGRSGSNKLGDMPLGTDSTIALKRACRMAQMASFHATPSVELNTICPLVFPPNGKIIVRGDNTLGSQIFLDDISRMREMGNSGRDFTNDAQYLKITRSPFDMKVEGNFCTILFIPNLPSDAIFGETVNINQLYVNDLIIQPCGFVGKGYGTLLRNDALVYNGRERFFNSLSQHHFNNVRFGVIHGGVTSRGVSGDTNPAGVVFSYTGYALGDRLRINGGSYRNFEKFIYIKNPESVEFKIENAEAASYAENTIWYDIPNNYSQFYVENTLALMKGDNQTLLKFIADYSLPHGYQDFSTASRVQYRSSRLEGGSGKKKILLDANYGQFTISDIESSASQGVEHTDSVLANLSALATAEFKNSKLPNKINLDLSMFGTDKKYDTFAGSIRTPMLTLKNCTFTNRLRVIQSTMFNGASYGQALLDTKQNVNLRIPVLKIIESPNVSRGDAGYGYYIPLPTYYGTFNSPATYDMHELYAPPESNGYIYPTKNIFGWNLPPFVRIDEINISSSLHTDKFRYIKLTVGKDSVAEQYVRIVDLSNIMPLGQAYTDAKLNVNLISNRPIGTQTDDPEKLFFRIRFVDEFGDEITGNHPPITINIRYRCLRSASEVVSLGLPAADIR